MKPLKVGDTLIVVEDDKPRPFDCTVSKIGRKLISVHPGPNWTPSTFRIDPAKPFLDGPDQWRAYTEEQWDFHQRKEAFRKAMREVERKIMSVGRMPEEEFDSLLAQVMQAASKASAPKS